MNFKQFLNEQLSSEAVTDAVYKLALSCFSGLEKGADQYVKYEAEQGRFYDSSIDYAVTMVRQFLGGKSDLDEAVDAFEAAVNDVGDRMVGYYGKAVNHAPGYKVPNVKFAKPSLNQVKAALMELPGMKKAK